MSKIIVYEHCNFGGNSKEFTSSVSSLIAENFNDCISSLKVIGAPWVAYADVNFKGKQVVFEEGEHASVEDNDRFSSLEMVTEDLSNPQITLYEHANYEGRSLVLKGETNLCSGSFNDIASSHKVQRGAWLLYEHADRSGDQMVARASRDVSFYEAFNDKLSYLRPLKPGKPSVRAEVLWNQKEEEIKYVILDTICGVNYGETEQVFSTEASREYEGSVADSFSFNNASQIRMGSKFVLNVGMMSGTKNFSLSSTFAVEKGSSNARVEKKSVRVLLPAAVPAHTKLTVKVVRKEVGMKFPVLLTITTGCICEREFGEYRCLSGNTITYEDDKEKI